jgi:hypothetical protein
LLPLCDASQDAVQNCQVDHSILPMPCWSELACDLRTSSLPDLTCRPSWGRRTIDQETIRKSSEFRPSSSTSRKPSCLLRRQLPADRIGTAIAAGNVGPLGFPGDVCEGSRLDGVGHPERLPRSAFYSAISR